MAKKNKQEVQPWDILIRLAETKIERSKRKTDQLEALLAIFRDQAKAGDPCPIDVASLGGDLTSLLQ